MTIASFALGGLALIGSAVSAVTGRRTKPAQVTPPAGKELVHA
jgi:hypothetical protein